MDFMKDKIPYSQRAFRGKFKYSMLIFVILFVVTLALWVVTIRGCQFVNIAKYDKTVDAPLVGYDVVDIMATKPTTTIEILYHYEYTDETGIVYKGDARAYINDFETADKAIENGQTVKIHIDGNGNSFLASTDISQTKRIKHYCFLSYF